MQRCILRILAMSSEEDCWEQSSLGPHSTPLQGIPVYRHLHVALWLGLRGPPDFALGVFSQACTTQCPTTRSEEGVFI